MTAVVDVTLGELLSPSQVNTFLSCPAKWYFRYGLGVREPPTGTLALGTAFHSVLAANFRQKIETNQDLPVEELEESFGEAFAIAAENAEFREDEEPAALIETGRALVRTYMADAAPLIFENRRAHPDHIASADSTNSPSLSSHQRP